MTDSEKLTIKKTIWMTKEMDDLLTRASYLEKTKIAKISKMNASRIVNKILLEPLKNYVKELENM